MEDIVKPPTTGTQIPPQAPVPTGPVMDIVPPVQAQTASAVSDPVQQEPNQPSDAPVALPEPPKSDSKKTKEKNQQQPGPVAEKPHSSAPVAAILLAILSFIVLAGLAYLAYTRG